jgi:hypothetical protein
MFFADHLAAFRNLGGALRPDGRLCMAVWAGIADNVHWRIPFEIAVRHVGPPKPQPPQAPGPMALSDPDYVRGVLSGAGFTAIAIEPTRFDVIGKSAASEAELAGVLGPSGRLLEEKEADDATRRAVVAETTAAFAAYAGGANNIGGEIRLPGTFLLLRAQRPA